MSARHKVILPRELLAYRTEVKGEIFRQIRKEFNRLKETEDGFNQKTLAERLGLDTGLLSRRMRGEHDMRLETLSDLARGLACKIEVKLIPLAEIPKISRITRQEVWTDAASEIAVPGRDRNISSSTAANVQVPHFTTPFAKTSSAVTSLANANG